MISKCYCQCQYTTTHCHSYCSISIWSFHGANMVSEFAECAAVSQALELLQDFISAVFWQYYHWNLGYLCSAQPDWIELTVHIFPFITGDDSAVVFTTQIQDSKSVCNNNSFKPLFGMFIYFPMRSICCAKSSEMLMGPRWPLKLQNWD